ncbi:hypothetical protein ACQEVG_21120 [Streptomyces sp. CA-135486]|uniref:hypothetical protein n=1 Tax=Streptomyces sp. CA-135486 TaxID=3240049 RepID=UPI003D8D82C7
MDRRISPKVVGRISEAEEHETADIDPSSEGDWLAGEILKVLMGADVEVEPEGAGSTCVGEE